MSTLELEESSNNIEDCNGFFNKDHSKFFQNNSFEKLENVGSTLFSRTYKVFSTKCNKIFILNKIIFSQKYTLKNFIADLKQYQKIELHANILKFVSIIEQSTNKAIFVHEYANDGTLRQYLKRNSNIINWNDKLRLAKQLNSAIKCLHENDIIHMNLNSENIFVHRGDIKLSAFQYYHNVSDIFKFMPYIDSQYLENVEMYKFNKSSDIYSIGILLWEISSGIIPFKSKLTNDISLFKEIINGKREVAIIGTPTNYKKIYTECWQHHSDNRPTIQHIFKCLNNININNYDKLNFDEEIIVESNKIKHENSASNITGISQHYHNEVTNELKLISSIVTFLKKTLNEKNLFEDQNNIAEDQNDILPVCINKQSDIDNEQKFLYDLNQLFISQFNIQGVSKYTSSSIIYHINKFISDNHQIQSKVFYKYNNHQYRSCFTSIIGFFYEHGIGTVVDHYKAFEMYKQAADECSFTSNNSLQNTDNFLKENRRVGLISLGLLYLYGQGVAINQQKALQLFLQSVSIGSSLGKCYVADCYYYGYGTIEDKFLTFAWSLKAAKEGNARAQNMVGYSYMCDVGISKSNDEAFKWFMKSAENGNYLAYNNLGNCYQYGIGTSVDKKKAFEFYLKSAYGENGVGQYNLGNCYQYAIGTSKNLFKAFNWYLKSANLGYSLGQNNLGYCYEFGIGTFTERKKAFEWYMKSAGGGSSLGQNSLGDCYRHGVETSKNEKLAFEWYMKSAEGGCSSGQNNLGDCYRYGIGTTIDRDLAFKWYMKSAEDGNSSGQHNLGCCYKYGIGTYIDEKKAFVWHMKSNSVTINLPIANAETVIFNESVNVTTNESANVTSNESANVTINESTNTVSANVAVSKRATNANTKSKFISLFKNRIKKDRDHKIASG
ncbi:hypothetical protein C2G38_2195747 [Gigaspora rosea]|uniref:Protein kinase domain-containing protein n=1 Tax=Gigaspora rosea TaxID=44941 RepID=A0A397UWQ1_9GLOM|nr:hypothetical protein C2G38_2195747 [Gigaspora rosea]